MRATKFILPTSVAAASESARTFPHPPLEVLQHLCLKPEKVFGESEYQVSCTETGNSGSKALNVQFTHASGVHVEPLPAECFSFKAHDETQTYKPSLQQCTWFGESTTETANFMQQVKDAAFATKEAAIQFLDAAKPVVQDAVHKTQTVFREEVVPRAEAAVHKTRTIIDRDVKPAVVNGARAAADGAKKAADSIEEDPYWWMRAGLISVLLILLAAVLAYLITKE